MEKVDILQVGPYPEWDQVPLDEAFVMHKYYEAEDTTEMLNSVGQVIRGIATRGELGADRKLIESCPNLEIISVYGVGYDAVDLVTCKERGIRITNTPDVLTGDVADLGVAMMLAQSRGMIAAEAWVRNGDWISKGLYPLKRRVHKARVGVLGLGRIGFEVAKRLSGFDMDIAYSDVDAKDYAPVWEFVADPIELAKRSDLLFVTLAASEETQHIVGREVIKALGADGMVINISRASNIDEDALLDALEKKPSDRLHWMFLKASPTSIHGFLSSTTCCCNHITPRVQLRPERLWASWCTTI